MIGSTGTLEVMIAAEAVNVVMTLLQTVGADVVVNAEGEEGALVSRGFEYNSGNNPVFLTVDEIRKMNKAEGY